MAHWVCSIYDFSFVYCICLIVREKKLRIATKQCIFYVTVRSRSESRAWPIFGAPWRQCFSSMHWIGKHDAGSSWPFSKSYGASGSWTVKNSPLVQVVKKSCCHTEVHMSSAHATSRQCYGMYSCRITFHSLTLLAQVKFLNVSKCSLFPHHNSDFNTV